MVSHDRCEGGGGTESPVAMNICDDPVLFLPLLDRNGGGGGGSMRMTN